MQISCPSCGEKLGVPADAAGRQGRCPKCRFSFIIPATAEGRDDPAQVNVASEAPMRVSESPGPAPVRPHGASGAVPVKPPPLPPRGAGSGVAAGHVDGAGPVQPGGPKISAAALGARLDSWAAGVLAGTPLAPAATGSLWQYRHEKEKLRFILAAIFSTVVWLLLLIPLVLWTMFALPVAVVGLLVVWARTQGFRARVLGGSVRVAPDQYPEIYAAARDVGAKLGLQRLPDIFVINSEGAVNALARRMVGGQFVFLFSGLVDLMLHSGRQAELDVILAHELAHHAAGHMSAVKNWYLKPAMFLPFVGSAYRRACELTADRMALVTTGNLEAAQRALAALASGSSQLMRSVNLEAMVRQEEEISDVLAFLNQVFESHPRLTQRIVELGRYAARQGASGTLVAS